MQSFIDVMADFPAGTYFRAGGNTKFGETNVVSLQAVLNGEVRTGDDHARVEPIQLHGWGYDRVSGQYETSVRIGRGMKTVSRKPWRSGEKEITFTTLDDSKNKTSVYRLEVTEKAA